MGFMVRSLSSLGVEVRWEISGRLQELMEIGRLVFVGMLKELLVSGG
jgi:hypothetical protein